MSSTRLDDLIIFQASVLRFKIDGIDRPALAGEVLSNQKRLSDNPHMSLFEDTAFDPKPDSVGAALVNEINSIAKGWGMAIHEIWSQIHHPRESTGLHNHVGPVNVGSFVYYVSVPQGAGDLIFQFENDSYTAIKPEEGMALFFAPWVKHKVAKNMSSEIRISVAGNLTQLQN